MRRLRRRGCLRSVRILIAATPIRWCRYEGDLERDANTRGDGCAGVAAAVDVGGGGASGALGLLGGLGVACEYPERCAVAGEQAGGRADPGGASSQHA